MVRGLEERVDENRYTRVDQRKRRQRRKRTTENKRDCDLFLLSQDDG